MKNSAKITALLTFCIFSIISVMSKPGLPENIAKYTSQGFETYWIGDNAKEMKNNISHYTGMTEKTVKDLGFSEGVPASMSVFLIKADGQNLLFDTGLGTPESLLLPSLSAIGVNPADVNAIFITHLHGDHTGGLGKEGEKTFPNATIYISRTEYEKMDGEKILEPYKGHIVLFDFDDELICGIKAIDASGHTPGHTCFLKGDVLIAGDIMHAVALQIDHPEFCAPYDKDPEASVATRKRILNMAKSNNLLLCGMHFPKGGVIDYRK